MVGFVLPLFWVFASIALMGPRDWWTDAYWAVVHITCPFGLTNGTGLGNALARSSLNALLYGMVVGSFATFWKQLHADSQRTD